MIMMGYWIPFDAMESLDPNQTLTRDIVSQAPAAHTMNKHKLVVDFSTSLLPLPVAIVAENFPHFAVL